MQVIKASKKALIFGCTGLIGSHLLVDLLADDSFKSVVSFARKPLEISNEKLTHHVIDFEKLDSYKDIINGSDLFICLGTTMAIAGSKEAFYKIDFEYVVKIATIAANNGVGQLFVVSSVGADVNSLFYYSRVKGEMESAIKKLDFTAIHIFRPSLLLGMRDEERAGEEFVGLVTKKLDGWFGNILPESIKKYRPIEAYEVAKSMLMYSKQIKKGFFVHENADILSVIN